VDNELSDPQAKIYHFIGEYTRRYGRPPTNREIGEAVHVHSTGYVDYHLTILEDKGYIQRQRRTSRGIRLTSGDEAQGLRIVGTIAAGYPLDIYSPAQQDMLDLSTHPREYVLLVRGQSMIEDHITDGDYVLVDKDAYINDGDIIVATHKVGNVEGGEATLKRIYRGSDHIRLQPANSAVNPIIITPEEWDSEWEVQGKVTAVHRRC
jgi:repressor LexA